MNILFANTQEFNPKIGGVERVTDSLTKQFLKRKNFCVYFITAFKSPYSKKYKPAAEQYFLPNTIDLLSEENVEFFSKFILNYNIDILINQAGNILDFSSLCISVKKHTGVKLISNVHIDPYYKLKVLKNHTPSYMTSNKILVRIKKVLKFIYRWHSTKTYESMLYSKVYNESDATVLLSQKFYPNFKKLVSSNDWSRLKAISNPSSFIVNEQVFEKKQQLLYVGRLEQKHKGVDRLLTLWKMLYLEFPDWELLIVGDGPFRGEMEKYVIKNNLSHIYFKGFQDPQNYYKSASIFCMTSTFEGFGMVLIEAAQHSCIPIAFRSFESLDDIIDNGVNGFAVTPFSLDEYHQKLRQLMSDDLYLSNIKKEALKINDKFTVDIIVNKWIELFQKI